MNNKHIRKIGRKLKGITICPLLIGILICSALTLTILYYRLNSWIANVKSTLEQREKDHLTKLSEVRSQLYSSVMHNDYEEALFLSRLFAEIAAGGIQKSPDLTGTTKVNLGTYLKSPELHKTDVLMISPQNVEFKDLPNRDELELFLVILKSYNQFKATQLGLLLNDGTEFRYPPGNMSYITSLDPCKTGNYDSRCLSIYSCQDCTVYKNFSMAYESNLTFLVKNDSFSILAFENHDFFTSLDEGLDNYFYFLSDNSTKKVFDSSEGGLSKYGKNISELLLQSKEEVSSSFQSALLESLAENRTYFELEGYNSYYLVSFNSIEIVSGEPSNLICVTAIIERLATLNYKQFFDKIYNINSIQVSIFIIYIIVGLFITSYISSSITTRITKPLSIIETYLRGLTIKVPKMKYNKEVNDIDKYLIILETIEHLLDPRYLLHPNKKQRLQNLKEVSSLFMTIKNNKGIAITKNLIGNLFLEDDDYDKAIDMYRESLAEMEALYNEVIAQEHAETKLTFEERKILKHKTGKDSQNWEIEKSSILFNITERIQQLYLAKQLSLENSLDSACELRSEWKSVLELQTKALQHYISNSNSYINMLKVILDISYVYHKLQYFHTALELLDVVYEEISKLTPELTEQAKLNTKGVTIDIDITRLKRLSLKVKDSDGRKLYFQVGGITFEKDILRQLVFYNRASIYKDNERYHEAALYFTMAIEQGTWYDPEIRKLSLEQLYQIYSKFKLIHDEPLLLNLYEKTQIKKKSTIFCLCYDVFNEALINEAVIYFTSNEIQSQIENFGSITENNESKFWLECVERDFPGLDIENQISSVGITMTRYHVYDVLLAAFSKLPKNSLETTIVIFCKNLQQCLGPGRLSDIEESIESEKLIFVLLDDSLPDELLEFVKKNKLTLIYKPERITEAFEELKKIMFN